MDDALFVRGVESIGNLNGQVQSLLVGERPALNQLFQRFALEILHGDEGFAVLFANIVYGADIWMA